LDSKRKNRYLNKIDGLRKYYQLLKPVPRAVVGLLSDMLSRNYVGPDIATFTVCYDRLLQIFPLMAESFLNFKAWQRILKRID